MFGRETHGVMLGRIGLDYDLSPQVTASGPARDLGYKVKSAFPRTKIRQVKVRVRRNHANLCDLGKIQALGYHLRPNYYVKLVLPEFPQHLIVRASF